MSWRVQKDVQRDTGVLQRVNLDFFCFRSEFLHLSLYMFVLGLILDTKKIIWSLFYWSMLFLVPIQMMTNIDILTLDSMKTDLFFLMYSLYMLKLA
jgi:hypothetical protein